MHVASFFACLIFIFRNLDPSKTQLASEWQVDWIAQFHLRFCGFFFFSSVVTMLRILALGKRCNWAESWKFFFMHWRPTSCISGGETCCSGGPDIILPVTCELADFGLFFYYYSCKIRFCDFVFRPVHLFFKLFLLKRVNIVWKLFFNFQNVTCYF